MKKTIIINGQKRTIDVDKFDIEAENEATAISNHNDIRLCKNDFYTHRRLQQCFPYNDENVSRLVQV